MTSGTTEKKTYTKAEVMEMLYHYQLEASKIFIAAQHKIEARLAKAEIPVDEYTAFVTAKKEPNATLQTTGDSLQSSDSNS